MLRDAIGPRFKPRGGENGFWHDLEVTVTPERITAKWDGKPFSTDPAKIQEKLSRKLSRFDLRLMSWGDGSAVPTSGKNLVVVGTDNNGSLHIRIFDAAGHRTRDEDETRLPAQAAAIATLKRRLPGLAPPRPLTFDEKVQVIEEAILIVGAQTELTKVTFPPGGPIRPGFVPRFWPRGGLGLYLWRGSASFRAATVTPL